MLQGGPQAGISLPWIEQAQHSCGSGVSAETPDPPPPKRQQGSLPDSEKYTSEPAPSAGTATTRGSGRELQEAAGEAQGGAPEAGDSAEGKGAASSGKVLKSVDTRYTGPVNKRWGGVQGKPPASPFSYLRPGPNSQ